MKGIILAGGLGTRLDPLTRAVSKHLLPVFNKPMIYYPMTTLMLGGMREFLIISTQRDLPLFKRLFRGAETMGLRIAYMVQRRASGIAQALLLGASFVGDEPYALILGDNLFYGPWFEEAQWRHWAHEGGATILACEVKDPQRYGVIEVIDGKPVSLEEKPVNPRSNLAVPGLYFYDKHAVAYARELRPSWRGELEITDVNARYLQQGTLRVISLGAGNAWFDMGTFDALLQASQFVQTIEQRQGLCLGSIEETARRFREDGSWSTLSS